MFVSGTQRDYWNSQQTTREYQMGYSNAIGRASYTLSASRVRNRDSEEETRLYLSLSLPFSLFDNNAWITSSLTASDSHYEQSNISMSGNALASNRLSYTLSGSNARGVKMRQALTPRTVRTSQHSVALTANPPTTARPGSADAAAWWPTRGTFSPQTKPAQP